MYEKLGRMMGRSYEETVQILNKALRNAESQTRIEVMLTFEKVPTKVYCLINFFFFLLDNDDMHGLLRCL